MSKVPMTELADCPDSPRLGVVALPPPPAHPLSLQMPLTLLHSVEWQEKEHFLWRHFIPLRYFILLLFIQIVLVLLPSVLLHLSKANRGLLIRKKCKI